MQHHFKVGSESNSGYDERWIVVQEEAEHLLRRQLSEAIHSCKERFSHWSCANKDDGLFLG